MNLCTKKPIRLFRLSILMLVVDKPQSSNNILSFY
ncbi:MAG: hypothetical protein ACI89Z_001620 [Porticoccus sp.]